MPCTTHLFYYIWWVFPFHPLHILTDKHPHVVCNNFLHIGNVCLFAYSWSVWGEWGRVRWLRGLSAGHRPWNLPAITDIYFVSCRAVARGPKLPVTPLLVGFSVTGSDHWSGDGMFWLLSRDIGFSRRSCQIPLLLDGIQLPYIFSTVSLSLITRAKHVRLQSKHVQAHFPSSARFVSPCLLPAVHKRGEGASLCLCVLLVERGGALESCVWFAWRPLLEEG